MQSLAANLNVATVADSARRRAKSSEFVCIAVPHAKADMRPTSFYFALH
jgi:hypothetical protein